MPGIGGISISPFLRKKSGNKYFTITVDTTKAGSANDTFVLPLPSAGTYDYYVDWGEGDAEEHFVVNTPQTHVYGSSGTYQIKITGTFPQIYFANAGDKLKLISIDNWGSIVWGSFNRAFWGCSNMDCVAVDSANTSSVEDFEYSFRGCTSLTTLNTSGWDTSSVTTFGYAFDGDVLLTALDTSGWDTSSVTSFYSFLNGCQAITSIDTSGWDTSSVTNFYRFARICYALKGSFAALDMTAATDITDMFFGCDINNEGTANYDATLVSWAAQAVNTGLTFNAGTSKYSAGGGGTAARAILTGAPNNWAITDGGEE